MRPTEKPRPPSMTPAVFCRHMVLATACLWHAAAVAETTADLFPADTVFYAELTRTGELAATVFDNPLRARIEALPAYQQAKASAEFQKFEQGKAFLEGAIGMDFRKAWETYAAGGLAFGWDGQQGVAIALQAADADSVSDLKDKTLALLALSKESRQVAEVEYRGIKAYRAGEIRVVPIEDRLLVTNSSSLGKAILDLVIDGPERALSGTPRFRQAYADRSPTQCLWAFADTETIRQRGIAGDAYDRQINNPVLELLVGGIQSGLSETPYVTASVDATMDKLAVRLAMPFQPEWIPETRTYYFGEQGVGRAAPVPQVEQPLLTLTTYRDFSQMWMRAGDLFNAQVNDEFAKADAGLTTIFAGQDFGEDVLGMLRPEVAFVATHQSFSQPPVPAIKLPQFGVIATLRQPEQMRRELRRTFQSIVGFLNIVGAMNGMNQLELGQSQLEGGGELVTATFVPERGEEAATAAPIQFNFSPSVGFSQDRFVLASTKTLAEELVGAQWANRDVQDNTRLAIDATTLAVMLDDNRQQLIAQNMLEEGHSREEAEAAIGLLVQVVQFFRDASLTLSSAEEHLSLDFQIRMQP